MSVLMLDRAEFPRDKPCGGGVNVRTAQLLPFDLGDVVERTIHELEVSVRAGKSYVRRSDEPLTYMTQRRRLDAYLAERAVSSGVTFRERAPLREVDLQSGRVTVKAASEWFRARALVGADGANGKTARLAGIPVERSLGIALEGNVHLSPGDQLQWRERFAVDVGSSPGGYGWLFPKGDHVNIGIGGNWPVGPSLRDRLMRLTRYYGFSPDALWGLNGHPLPVYREGSAVQKENVLLVGDAAGFVDPLTGEGIYSAVKSGQIAARHLAAYVSGAAGDLAGYRREIERDLVPDLLVSIQLHQIFHLAPPVAAEMVKRSSRMWRLVCALLTGRIGYAGVKERSAVLARAIDLASAAGRARSRLSAEG
jgi:geranylgeranyl reductase family protein